MSNADRDAAEFEGVPWRNVNLNDQPEARRVPTMLAGDEQRFYTWITQDWAEGTGAVVDLGAFAGGSTARLAAGAKAAGKPLAIHAYDKFTAKAETKQTELYDKGVPEFDGADILPLARDFLSPWADQITYHKGNIEELGWDGGPIEILAIDVFKKVDLIDPITRAFFPSLVPGRSLLVQQDFLHWSQPWICAQMELFGDVFEPVAFARRDSIAYLLRKPITEAVLKRAQVASLTDDDMQGAIASARVRFGDWGIQNRLDALSQGLAANPGARVSWQMKPPEA
ncbi:hypothetical protein [Candidatus Rhodobacter oscarellae]|nr:hypothetical protein [Candidatus Rhodobacter lobularis]